MKRLIGITIGATVALLGTTGSHAASLKQQPMHAVHLGTFTFHLAIAGNPAKGTTFWVSYGPLAGRFGVIRLQPNGNHLFSARVVLPTNEPGTFTYLHAQGTEYVHGLQQPGGVPVVIRNLESVTATTASQRIVRWSVPLG